VIEVSSTLAEPGVVHRHTPPERSWFAVDAGSRHARAVGDLLAHSGTVAPVDDIASAKWMKLVSNCSVLVPTALLGLPMLDAIAAPGLREVMLAAGREAFAVGAARAHRALPIFGLGADDLAGADGDAVVERMLDVLYDRFVVPGATTTVLQDWRKGRRSEAEDLNGLVVAEGDRLGIPTPVNAAILDAARAVERGDATPGPDGAERLRRALA
jgi:2-dehydropantoate 2-reductase